MTRITNKRAYLRIRGKRWTVVFQNGGDTNLLGWCDWINHKIVVRNTPDATETLIHEILHACQPDLSEAAVLEIETAIVHALDKFCPEWRT